MSVVSELEKFSCKPPGFLLVTSSTIRVVNGCTEVPTRQTDRQTDRRIDTHTVTDRSDPEEGIQKETIRADGRQQRLLETAVTAVVSSEKTAQ